MLVKCNGCLLSHRSSLPFDMYQSMLLDDGGCVMYVGTVRMVTERGVARARQHFDPSSFFRA